MEGQVEQVPSAAPAVEQQPKQQPAKGGNKKEKKAAAPKVEEPEWIKHRIAIWDELKKQSAQEGAFTLSSPILRNFYLILHLSSLLVM
jgi:hypothetical protein